MLLELFLRQAAAHILYLALHLEGSSFPRPLTPEQERRAFEEMAKGSTAARDTLIKHNLRLVAHIAKKYYPLGAEQDDLISLGTIGLIKAVNTFDVAHKVHFSSYASRCIENELRMRFRRLRREAPSVSLQEPLEGEKGGGLSVADVLRDESDMEGDVERRALAAGVREMLESLTGREREILTRRFGLDGAPPLTQLEVARRLGISRSYVSRIEKRAVERLRELHEG